jgi:hypothetical protein
MGTALCIDPWGERKKKAPWPGLGLRKSGIDFDGGVGGYSVQ